MPAHAQSEKGPSQEMSEVTGGILRKGISRA